MLGGIEKSEVTPPLAPTKKHKAPTKTFSVHVRPVRHTRKALTPPRCMHACVTHPPLKPARVCTRSCTTTYCAVRRHIIARKWKCNEGALRPRVACFVRRFRPDRPDTARPFSRDSRSRKGGRGRGEAEALRHWHWHLALFWQPAALVRAEADTPCVRKPDCPQIAIQMMPDAPDRYIS